MQQFIVNYTYLLIINVTKQWRDRLIFWVSRLHEFEPFSGSGMDVLCCCVFSS